jgi:predicted nucleotidyltransferase
MFPLAQHTIFVTLAGSHAHGTAREGSDVDLRGVCVAPLAARLSLFSDFEQYEGVLTPELEGLVSPRLRAHETASRGLAVKAECVVFDIAKLVRLCVAANPNALEILFSDERDWVLESPAWRRLHAERRRFLTKQVRQTFMGYAMAQLSKIQSHRSWLLHPPTKPPSREDFGLPGSSGTLSRDDQNRIEQSIADKLRSYGTDDLEMPKPTRVAVRERLASFYRDVLSAQGEGIDDGMRSAAASALHLPASLISTLDGEKRYRSAAKHWEAYQAWKSQRNPARAELERKHGYDTKHAMHLIRLMRMGLEILETGEFSVRRADASELSAIRDGALSFDELLATANDLRAAIDRAALATQLPEDVDRAQTNDLVVSLMLEASG